MAKSRHFWEPLTFHDLRNVAVVLAFAAVVSVFARMIRKTDMTILGIVGVLLSVWGGLSFWVINAYQGGVYVMGYAIDSVWIALALIAAAVVGHLWLSER